MGGRQGLLSKAARAEFCTAATALLETPAPVVVVVVTVKPGSCAARTAGEMDSPEARVVLEDDETFADDLERLLPPPPVPELSKSELPAPPTEVNCSSRSLSAMSEGKGCGRPRHTQNH